MQFPEDFPDYVERVYAGILGKLIGVYLGRPIEGWSYDRIMAELGEIRYYVHEQCGTPLIVTDDDISGTFTFLRALPDYGCRRTLTAAQIGQTWLNYIVEKRTILWWGGMGNSTEHTAYLRLKSGVRAPESGSIARNGRVVAEQIGSQIFIDGWGMVSPGDPEQAAELARRAASVSHDGEAIYGAQVVAALEAQAFVEADIGRLLDTATAFIPDGSLIARMIADLRELRLQEPDWRRGREFLAAHYGYDRYGGNCHIVPNHGLIILALLYGDGDFQKSLLIANTSGWDTDCNSGNVGCLLGIRGGLAALDAGPDWRGPVADRLYLPSADGGRAITDAVTETYHLVNYGRALHGLPPMAPKHGARYHFSLPGSVQGFHVDLSPETRGVAQLTNATAQSDDDQRALAIRYTALAPGRAARAAVWTFLPPETLQMKGYDLIACPTLYPGQTVRARIVAAETNAAPVTCRLYIRSYDTGDRLIRTPGPQQTQAPGEAHVFEWTLPAIEDAPITEVGVELTASQRTDGIFLLDYLTWDGTPDVTFSHTKPGRQGRRAWIDAVDRFESAQSEPFRLIQDRGVGLLIQGAREWSGYRASASLSPHMTAAAGLAVHVQGLRRYYALLLASGGKARLVKVLDGERILAETDFPWLPDISRTLTLEADGNRLRAWIDGAPLFTVADTEDPLACGAVALVCEEGRMAADWVRVQPIGQTEYK